jgi:hypothetical protein
VKDWHSEDEIKAQLRELTERTRKLRHDLDGMVRPAAEPNPARAFIHRQGWPKNPPKPPAQEVAADRKRKPKKPR